MLKFKIEKKLEATWLEVEAETALEATFKARRLAPDRQIVTFSRCERAKDKDAST